MEHLGDFGSQRAENDAAFGWFGTEVRVHPDLSDLTLIDVVQKMMDVDGEKDGAVVIQTVAGMTRSLIHPDDHEQFWVVAKENRQTMEDIVNLAGRLIGALAGRPTKLPSASTDGRQPTEPSSTAGSSSPALRVLEGQGRPDLAVAVLRAERAAS